MRGGPTSPWMPPPAQLVLGENWEVLRAPPPQLPIWEIASLYLDMASPEFPRPLVGGMAMLDVVRPHSAMDVPPGQRMKRALHTQVTKAHTRLVRVEDCSSGLRSPGEVAQDPFPQMLTAQEFPQASLRNPMAQVGFWSSPPTMMVQGIFAMENGPELVTGGLMETRVVLETPQEGGDQRNGKKNAQKCQKNARKCH